MIRINWLTYVRSWLLDTPHITHNHTHTHTHTHITHHTLHITHHTSVTHHTPHTTHITHHTSHITHHTHHTSPWFDLTYMVASGPAVASPPLIVNPSVRPFSESETKSCVRGWLWLLTLVAVPSIKWRHRRIVHNSHQHAQQSSACTTVVMYNSRQLFFRKMKEKKHTERMGGRARASERETNT